MRKRFLTQYIVFTAILAFISNTLMAQLPYPAMVGYWENWQGSRFVPLKDIDSRYNVIQIAFAEAKGDDDYDIVFNPPSYYTEASFKAEMKLLQDDGKKVLISLGGQNDIIVLDSIPEKDVFVSSMNELIDKWGFDGIDIDLEGNSLDFHDVNIENPGDIKQQLMIEGIHEIMQNYHVEHGEKLLLTMAPETFYVHGGLSGTGLGHKRGAYLPIIEAFKDSIDMLNVQLYNSGTMYGLDKKLYTQGTADWVIAMTEAVIRGFEANGSIGTYSGIPAHKVGVALPGCHSYDAVPHDEIKKALDYLLGVGPQPGNYTLLQEGGYPDLRGMMTWSINSDRKCSPSYGFVETWGKVFTDSSYFEMENYTDILEGEEDGGIIAVTLYNDTFVNPLDILSWEVKNLPTGVALDTVIRVNDSIAHLILKGSSSELYMRDITNVQVKCDEDQLEKKATGVVSDRAGLVLSKKPQLVPGVVEPEGYFDVKGAYTALNWEGEDSYYIRLNKSSWADIKIDVAADGEYMMKIKLATIAGDHFLTVRANGLVVLNKKITSKTFFRTWDEFVFNVNLTAGVQDLRLNVTAGWMDVESLTFEVDNNITEVGKSSLNIYPNPATDNFIYNADQDGQVFVHALNGQLVTQKTIIKGANQIPVSELKSGLYTVRFVTQTGHEYYDKLVKK